jgi:hypothetical protein
MSASHHPRCRASLLLVSFSSSTTRSSRSRCLQQQLCRRPSTMFTHSKPCNAAQPRTPPACFSHDTALHLLWQICRQRSSVSKQHNPCRFYYCSTTPQAHVSLQHKRQHFRSAQHHHPAAISSTQAHSFLARPSHSLNSHAIPAAQQAKAASALRSAVLNASLQQNNRCISCRNPGVCPCSKPSV